VAAFDLFRRVGEFAHFAGLGLGAAFGSIPHPARWLRPFYSVFIGGIPMAIVLGLALGAVIWLQTRAVLEQFPGANDLLPTVLTAAVLLELAPVGAGLIVAARTGASLGAELSAMKLGEQIDALELLGQSPRRVLVGPRILACLLAVPLLHVLVSMLAIGSSFASEAVAGNGNWLKYSGAVETELANRLWEVLLAAFKPVIFGGLIGSMGCWVGLRAEGGSEGVGHAATNSVVRCSLLVLAADVLLVGTIRSLLA
jgi:phospholipid/cholesterol/gamma-HCH transport system permease protein